jgi:type IV pilus assembly protein PilC
MSDILILAEEKEKKQPKSMVDSILSTGEEVKKMSFLESINNYIVSLQKISIKDKVVFFRLLSTMINAWISLVKAVAILERQEKNLVLKKILAIFQVELKQGRNLSECFALFPASFSEAEIGMIKAWEKTGKLNDTLNEIANQVEKVASITGKIKSAMMYPAMIMCVVFGVIAVMMTLVVPKLLDIFEDKSSLPASTKALIAISDAFTNYWYVMIIIVVMFMIGFNAWKRVPSGKYWIDRLKLQIPVFGMLLTKLILSKFARIFWGLLASGVSIVEALKIVSEALGNEVYRQRVLLLMEDVKQGMKIWESLDTDELFPDMMIQMIQVGEQTAKLDHTIGKVADFYDEQVDNTVATLNKLLEPFIIVFLAIVVGFIAVSIMQPIMGLANQVSNS